MPNRFSWLLLLPGHRGLELPAGQAARDLVAGFQRMHIFQELSAGIENERIATLKNGKGRQRVERRVQTLGAHAMLQEHVPSYSYQRCSLALEFLPHPCQNPPQI